MKNKILHKITKITSPLGQTGKTSLANNLALRFAQAGYLTAVIELDRYTGTSPYLNNTVMNTPERSLKKAMETSDEHAILQCFMHSEHHENLFFLSLRVKDEIHDLHRFSMAQIEKILRISRNRFDKIFIDVPMNYLDNGYFAALHFSPHQTLIVMDENVVGWHRLKQYDQFLKSIKTGYQRTALVINKQMEILPEAFINGISADLEIIRPEERFALPFLREMITAGNRGILLGDMSPASKTEDGYMTGLKSIERFILKESLLDDSNGPREKNRKGLLGLFGRKPHREKTMKQAEEAGHET